MKTRLPPMLVLLFLVAPQTILAEPEPVVSEIVVPASADVVWRAYTTREEIETWMVSRSSELELAIGGSWRTSYEGTAELDDASAIHNEVLAFDPGRMLAMRTVRPPSDFPFPDAILDTWTVLYIESIDESHTKVTTKMFGFEDTEESTEMRGFFEWGNAFELDKLSEYLSSQ